MALPKLRPTPLDWRPPHAMPGKRSPSSWLSMSFSASVAVFVVARQPVRDGIARHFFS